MLLVLALLVGCGSTAPPPGITAVAPFDAERYQGRWYELARLDHRFERGLTDVSAQYSLKPDGGVRVINRGYDVEDQRWREAEGRAVFTGPSTTGSLKVSFFGPFYGGYHVAALDPEYRWAIVVGPDRDYCWILARDKRVNADTREMLATRVRDLGIDDDALIWVTHERDDPGA
jgi:apolipoprotein D and lipocalin family protein